jgi:hypothetical protein
VGFLGHLCNDFVRQALRSVMLVGQLVAYWTAAQPDVVPLWLRVLFFSCSGSFFLYKALVLTVSLPRGRLPPDNPIARSLFTGDFRFIAVHIAESMAVIIIAALWCVTETLKYYYFIPVFVVMMLPLFSLLLRHQGSPCSTRFLMMLVTVIVSPVVVMIHLAKLVWQQPLRLADPSDAILHVFVTLVAIPMCWLCSSNLPVLVVWGLHSLLLAGCLLESTTVKRVTWKEGRIWWIFVQLSVLVVYVANLLNNFSKGLLAERPGVAQLLVAGASFLWLAFGCSLSFMVNWDLCVRQYRAWQHRNGSFTLGSSPTSAGGGGAGSLTAPAPQTIGASSGAIAGEGRDRDGAGAVGIAGMGIVPQQPRRQLQGEQAQVV